MKLEGRMLSGRAEQLEGIEAVRLESLKNIGLSVWNTKRLQNKEWELQRHLWNVNETSSS